MSDDPKPTGPDPEMGMLMALALPAFVEGGLPSQQAVRLLPALCDFADLLRGGPWSLGAVTVALFRAASLSIGTDFAFRTPEELQKALTELHSIMSQEALSVQTQAAEHYAKHKETQPSDGPKVDWSDPRFDRL